MGAVHLLPGFGAFDVLLGNADAQDAEQWLVMHRCAKAFNGKSNHTPSIEVWVDTNVATVASLSVRALALRILCSQGFITYPIVRRSWQDRVLTNQKPAGMSLSQSESGCRLLHTYKKLDPARRGELWDLG